MHIFSGNLAQSRHDSCATAKAANVSWLLAEYVAFRRRASCFPPCSFAYMATTPQFPALQLGGSFFKLFNN
jgi:hypothetical protein